MSRIKKIEVYERASGKVIETQELDEDGVRDFCKYFRAQGNTQEYSWRFARRGTAPPDAGSQR